jgi:hypothetical protein
VVLPVAVVAGAGVVVAESRGSHSPPAPKGYTSSSDTAVWL